MIPHDLDRLPFRNPGKFQQINHTFIKEVVYVTKFKSQTANQWFNGFVCRRLPFQKKLYDLTYTVQQMVVLKLNENQSCLQAYK
jgi:hypothetical protein